MAQSIYENKLNVILIQIDEAHSDAWPMYIDQLLNVEQPTSHKSFDDRVNRANYFVDNYRPPYPVYIDGWDNVFGNTFRAWPDQYHCIDKNFKVIAKSEYGTIGPNEAKIVEDYTELLQRLMNRK